jgi:hypothetical protein
MNPCPSVPSVANLTLEHLLAYAAWLTHGPGTVRQVAGKADLPMSLVHPRTEELLAIGGVRIAGQSETEGPIYLAVTGEVQVPSAADAAQRILSTLQVEDQVSIAAGVLSRHGRRKGGLARRAFGQTELL